MGIEQSRIAKSVVIRGVFEKSKWPKCVGGRSSAPDPNEEANSVSPKPSNWTAGKVLGGNEKRRGGVKRLKGKGKD